MTEQKGLAMPNEFGIEQYREIFHHYVSAQTEISKEQSGLLLPYFEVQVFTPGAVILEAGRIEQYLNLVVEGIVSKEITITEPNRHESTKEKTRILQLATQGHFIQAEFSYVNQVPSEVVLKTLGKAPTTLLRLHRTRSLQLFSDHPWVERTARILITKMLAYKEVRVLRSLEPSGEKRFHSYMAEHIDMLHLIPQHILAAYLGIAPETFSKLKKRSIPKKNE